MNTANISAQELCKIFREKANVGIECGGGNRIAFTFVDGAKIVFESDNNALCSFITYRLMPPEPRVKNYTVKEALEKLDPILNNMNYGESIQLSSLVKDFGYLGALQYLDPSVPRPWNPDRDITALNGFNILKNL